ncbi:hypothetical protein P9112_003582 [Eukaryota sp. TZLM1-RC]
MKTFLIALCVIAAVNAEYFLQSPNVHRVNSGSALWTAEVNPRFLGWTTEQLDNYFNDQVDENAVEGPSKEQMMGSNSLPESWDIREAHGCGKYILDQGSCGSCWAFGVSGAMTDRFCQATKNPNFPVLSPQELTSCDTSNHGCNGGLHTGAYRYMEYNGLATDACYPYISGKTRKAEDCAIPDKCKSEKYFAKKGSQQTFRKEEDIMAALMTHGTLKVGFVVYSDFMSYKSGIYHHVSGAQRGGHAVRLIGWGVENGVKYWTCANSWGSSWGENGTFRIRRGVNECNIESRGPASALPQL